MKCKVIYKYTYFTKIKLFATIKHFPYLTMPFSKAGLLADQWPQLLMRGDDLKSAVLVKVLFSEPWTVCQFCDRVEESGFRLW